MPLFTPAPPKTYRDLRDYMPGGAWGNPAFEIGQYVALWAAGVLAGTEIPSLYLPPTPAGFALWTTAVYYPCSNSGYTGGFELFGSSQTVVQFGLTGTSSPLGGTTDGDFALHIDEAATAPTSAAAGWGAGNTGTPTNGGGRIFIRDLFLQNPSGLTNTVFPSFMVVNHMPGVMFERVYAQRLQYCRMTIGYTDDVMDIKSKQLLPHDSGFALGEGFFYREISDGDGYFGAGLDGGNSANFMYLSNIRGGTINGAITVSGRLVSCSGFDITGFHFDTDQNQSLSSTMPAYWDVQSSEVNFQAGWWHRGKLENPQPGVPIVCITDIANPSKVRFYGVSPVVGVQPIGGAFTAVPDVYIAQAVEGTSIVVKDTAVHGPNGINNKSKTGFSVRAALPAFDNVLTSVASLAKMAADFEVLITSPAGVPTCVVQKPGGVPRYITPLAQHALAVSASAANDLGGNPGALTTARFYVVVLDNGYGFCTAYLTAQSATPTAGVNGLNLALSSVTGPCVARIWGSATDPIAAPTVYAQIPLSGPSTLTDVGASIHGYVWATTGIPSVGSVADAAVNHANWPGVERNDVVTCDLTATAPPATGWYPEGITRVRNPNAAAGGSPGWVCVASGSPSTFKAEAAVAA